jgi:beta-N-acetylhexosaminidase
MTLAERLIYGIAAAVVLSACIVARVKERDSRPTNKTAAVWIEQTLKQLSLEEKVGQMLQVRCYASYKDFESPDYKRVQNQLEKYHIGSVVLGMHFDKSGPVRSSPLDLAKTANQLQHDSKLPLLLAADLERGVASRLNGVPSFPWPMAFGAADDPSQVERFAAITAREARAVGIQWALAPVADLNSNPANPIINDRSFGENPERVSSMIVAFIRGAHKNGLLVTAKHFPGNGDTSVDSHRAIASIDADIAHLRNTEFLPFEAAISASVDSIMLAHARVAALEPDSNKITTISSNVVTGSLKGELGFKGVVVTDALEMEGIKKLYDPAKGSPTARAALDAVRAGCDVIMMPTDLDGAFHAIIDAVTGGDISESRIDESVRKILAMKAAVSLDKNRFVDIAQVAALTSKPEDVAVAQEVADKAVTLVRDNAQLLPFKPVSAGIVETARVFPGKKMVAVILGEPLEEKNGREFERGITARRPDAIIFRFDGRFSGPTTPQLLKAIVDADEIVLATYVAHRAPKNTVAGGSEVGSFGLPGLSGSLFQEIVSKYPQKTVVIALGSPYLIESFPQIQTYICTYAMTSTSEISAVKALFGEVQNLAKLPVTLPAIAQRGFSIPWPTTSSQPRTAGKSAITR